MLRPVYFSSGKKLLEFSKSLDPVCDLDGATTPTAIQKKLEEYFTSAPHAKVTLAESVVQQEESTTSDSESESIELSKQQKLLKSIIGAAFLPKLEGKAKAAARRGLDLEKPLAKKFLK